MVSTNPNHLELTTTQSILAHVAFTAFWYILRLWVQRRVAEYVKNHPKLIPDERREAFSESFWKAVSYTGLVIFDYFSSLEYFEKPLALYDEFPNTTTTPAFVFFYLLQVTYYMAATIQHIDGTEERRKDFWQMLIHHFATIALVAGSFNVGLFRIGTIVFLFHDVCDVILESAKMATFMKWKYDEVIWITLMVAWVAFRIVLFSMKVLIPIWYDINYLAENKIVPETIYWYRRPLAFFLYTITALNIFWLSLMIKGAWKILVKKEKFEGDPREKKQLQNDNGKGESESESNNKNHSNNDNNNSPSEGSASDNSRVGNGSGTHHNNSTPTVVTAATTSSPAAKKRSKKD